MEKNNSILSFVHKNEYQTNGNLALKTKKINYETPKIKKLKYEKPKITIVMGCWQQSYVVNDGDGC